MNRTQILLPMMLAAVILLSVACKPRAKPDAHVQTHSGGTNSAYHPSGFPSEVTAYDVKGVVEEIRANGKKALIAHQDIPGYMEAMTMLLDVKDTNELRGLLPGDAIRFRMLVTDSDGWIDQVQRIGTNPVPPKSSGVATPPMEELEAGALLPDCTLTNQLGQPFRLSEFKGRALAFTFIFTRCPFPVYCPRMNSNLSEVQHQLLESPAGTNWQLISISFDPDFDTPATLAKYAERYHFNARFWSFATGSTEDIRKLGGAFGLAFWHEGALFNHNVRTVVVDSRGRVQKIFNGNEWKPVELVEEIRKGMMAEGPPPTPVNPQHPP